MRIHSLWLKDFMNCLYSAPQGYVAIPVLHKLPQQRTTLPRISCNRSPFAKWTAHLIPQQKMISPLDLKNPTYPPQPQIVTPSKAKTQKKMMRPLILKLINFLKNHSFPMLMQPWHCVSRLAVVKSMRILLRSTSSELPTEQPQHIHPNQRPPAEIRFRKTSADPSIHW